MNTTLQNQFRDLFENEYPGMDDLREKLIRPLWKDISTPSYIVPIEQKDTNKIKKITIFANQGSDINFVDVELSDTIVLKKNKATINRYITNKIVDIYQSALIFFHYENNQNEWRISYVYKGENNSDRTNAKRYTYLCGKGIYCRTAAERFAELEKSNGYPNNDKLIDAFSVENLTKEFFGQLFNWYSEWACKVCLFPSDNCIAAHAELTTDKNEINLIRLITRIMFVWFIKQKKLIPTWIFNKDELETILSDPDFLSDKKGNYYNAVLQNLFFGALNNKINERSFAKKSEDGVPNEQYGIKTFFRDANEGSFFKIPVDDVRQKFIEVPFLNGGLFECLDKLLPNKEKFKVQYVDGFSRNKDRRAFVPNILFWNEDEKHPGLFTILSRYNFTIEESTPNDVQVALDPELLGKVFENLLGTYNPETRESARKESGSFYTPREIVSYMVNHSIISFLKENVSGVNETLLEKITSDAKIDNSEIELTNEQINNIRNALNNIKILDPACGSGAFPMGILNKLIEIHTLLNHLQEKPEESLYSMKLRIIEQSLFGVDIQPIAVQICKLRFFISLICEQPKLENQPEKNYGYDPLPNLETKFVAANTLISLDKEEKNYLNFTDETIVKFKTDLSNVRKEHFSAKTSNQKIRNRETDEQLREQIIEYLKKNSTEINETRINELKAQEKFFVSQIEKLPVCMVSKDISGEDLFGNNIETEKYDKNEKLRKQTQRDLNNIREQITIEINKNDKSTTIENLEKLVEWNPYDQSADASKFFDSDWMFGIRDGFDIVIGNPPYVRRTKIDDKLKIEYEARYKSATRQYDLYLLFLEHGIDLLKNKGHLCYINPIRFFNSDYGIDCRKVIANNTKIISILDVSQLKVFESAMTYPCIMLLQKTNDNLEKNSFDYKKLNDLKDVPCEENIKPEILSQKRIIDDIYSKFLVYRRDELFDIMTKIDNSSEPISNYYSIARGLANNKVDFTTNKFLALKSKMVKKYHIKGTPIQVNTSSYKTFKNEMILLPRTVEALQATIKEQNIIVLDRIYYLTPLTSINDKFVLACINAKITNEWFEYQYSTTKVTGNYFDLNGNQIGSIPIPLINSEEEKNIQSKICSLVDSILDAKKEDININTQKEEKTIDHLIYKLYGISDQTEIDLIEGK